jgi:hypothetical protein
LDSPGSVLFKLRVGARLIGVALNDIDLCHHGYPYGYYHCSGYGESYGQIDEA